MTGISHNGIRHEDILKNIKCKTIFMKVRSEVNEDGVLMEALSENDLEKITELVKDFHIIRFDCGHGIHMENPKKFTECLVNLIDMGN